MRWSRRGVPVAALVRRPSPSRHLVSPGIHAGFALILLCVSRILMETSDFAGIRGIALSGVRQIPCDDDRCECHRPPAVTVRASTTGLVVSTPEVTFAPIPIRREVDGQLDVSLVRRHLDWVKTTHPESASADVQCDDEVEYGDLVRLLDTCLGAGLPLVTVAAPRVRP
jgi:hypothetical protein